MSDTILSRISKPVKTNDLPKITKIAERTFGRWRIVVQKEDRGLIARFYDVAQDPVRFEGGQFVTSYYVETLLGMDQWSDGGIGEYEAFSLDMGCEAWTIYQPELTQIDDWLRGIRSKEVL